MSLPEIVEAIHSNNYAKQKDAVHDAKGLLSSEDSPPIGLFISHKVVPKLVEFLRYNDDPEIQFEAAWILTIVAREQTHEVIDEGAIPVFISLLSNSSSDHVKEQAVVALGHIAGENVELRDSVIEEGILQPLLALITPNIQTSFLRNVTKTLSNLCRLKNPPPPEHVVSDVLPHLKNLIGYDDREVIADACWALSYLTDASNIRIQVFLDAEMMDGVVNLLQSQELEIITPALKIIGNITTGTDEQTQVVLDTGVLNHFTTLLTHSESSIQRESCWTLSNITAGPPHQIARVIEAQLLPPLLNVLKNGDIKAKKEACWAISNMTTGGSFEQIVIAIQTGCLPPLCDVLDASDSRLIWVAMEGIGSILEAYQKMNQLKTMRDMLEQINAVKKIENLQNHTDENLRSVASNLFEKYLDDEEY